MPATSLKFNAKYTATIDATSAGGATQTVDHVVHDDGRSRPRSRSATSINVTNGATYGVAMPIVLTFGTAIPAKNRADVERRLFVQSSPAQRGIWSWQSATQVVYRPQTYWQTGTSVTVRTALGRHADRQPGDRRGPARRRSRSARISSTS